MKRKEISREREKEKLNSTAAKSTVQLAGILKKSVIIQSSYAYCKKKFKQAKHLTALSTEILPGRHKYIKYYNSSNLIFELYTSNEEIKSTDLTSILINFVIKITPHQLQTEVLSVIKTTPRLSN